MGQILRKRARSGHETAVSQSPESSPAQETHQSAHEFGAPIFLHNFKEVGGDLVNFNADLDDIDGSYVLQNVTKDGLAYSAGFRNGDKLFEINSTNIEGRGIAFILDLLRTFPGYNGPPMILAVERKPLDSDEPEFIWVIFEVVWHDGVPKIRVIQTLQNNEKEMPFIDFDSSTMSWNGSPADPYDIYIDGSPQLYLSVQNDKFAFTAHNMDSTLYRYKYIGGVGNKGVVAAYSLDCYKPEGDKPKKKHTTLAVSEDNTVSAMDFPDYMKGENIPPDARMWYQKIVPESGSFTLESVVARDMYLGKGPNDEAILSTTKTKLIIGASRSRVVKPPGCPAVTK